MTNTRNHALIQMIDQIRTQIFERVRRGQLDYPRDIKTLQNHLEIAREVGDQILMGQLYLTLGYLECEAGNFRSAESYWHIAYDLHQRQHNNRGMGAAQNSLGELYRRQNRLDRAMEAYYQARALFEQIRFTRGIMLAESNIGLTWLAQQQYDQAQICFNLVLALTEDQTWDHLAGIIEVRRGLAEIFLAKKQFREAWSHVKEAERLAAEARLKIQLAQAYLTEAHIAAVDPQAPKSSTEYERLSRECLAQQNPLVLARHLLLEARYQKNHHPGDAFRLANEAMSMFNELGLNEEIRLAQEVLNALAHT